MSQGTDFLQQLTDDIKEFEEHTEKAVKSYVTELLIKPAPPLIYHYTDYAGLKGILESGRIWLTDVFSLNDPSEVTHGFGYAIKTLADRSAATKNLAGRPLPSTTTGDIFAKQFELFLARESIKEVAHFFVCCFSSNGDELGQWRAYADNGRGYALGFKADELENAFALDCGDALDHRKLTSSNGTFPIDYDGAKILEFQNLIVDKLLDMKLIDRIFEVIVKSEGNQNYAALFDKNFVDLITCLITSSLQIAVHFKHEAYKNEQEYRFLQIFGGGMPSPDFKMRIRPHELVRYREFDWRARAPQALKTIVLGPATNREKSTRFARDCLRAYHPGSVDVVPSTIPYRASQER